MADGRGSHKSRDGRELRNVYTPQKLGEAKSGLFPGVPEECSSMHGNFKLLLSKCLE